jgi:hypothetical protein
MGFQLHPDEEDAFGLVIGGFDECFQWS